MTYIYMMGHCHEHNCDTEPVSEGYKKILWIALTLNLIMFIVEIGAGLKGNSLSLLADAIDFFGDAGNYAISIFVLGMSVHTRAKASLFKAACMGSFGIYIIGYALYSVMTDTMPAPHVMGVVGFLAMLTNVAVALMLYKYREGDSNMESVWLCSRNDALGNIAVMLAALAVFMTDSKYPDLLVAIIMGILGISAATRVIRSARKELAQADS